VRDRTSERGLSLIEVLVAITIFTLVAAAVTALTTSAIMTADWNKDRAHAMAIADSEIEDVRSAPYAGIGTQFQIVTRDGRRFSVLRLVEPARRPGEPPPTLTTLTVFVTWSQRNRRTHTYRAQTLVTDVGQ